MDSRNQQGTDIPIHWSIRAFFLRMAHTFLAVVYSKRLWRKHTDTRCVYLTFDDGPIPELTPWVLQQLAAHQAKATFFCIGQNVERNPEIFHNIVKEGHTIGNHTHRHLDGWKTKPDKYAEDIALASKHIASKLFRPPYGHLTRAQEKELLKTGYQIVMWDVLAWDWEQQESAEDCFWRVISTIRHGSIVVFHDSLKAEPKLRATLPRVLTYLRENGWTFGTL